MDEPRVLGYIRASTKKQVESPDTQKDLIRKYTAFNDLPDAVFYTDAAKSGKTPIDERTAGAAMFVDVRRGDHVIVAKLDRMFRKLSDCVLVLERFERMGVKLHVVNLMGGAIDLSSPMGKFILHVLASFAELERAFISERTKDGLANCKRKATAHSRYPGYGFKWEKKWVEGKLCKVAVRDDKEREVMGEIVAWRMQRKTSWDEISRHIQYTLKLVTKDGGNWDANRVRRAFNAELNLQLTEQKVSR